MDSIKEAFIKAINEDIKKYNLYKHVKSKFQPIKENNSDVVVLSNTKIRQLKGLGAKPFKGITANIIWTIIHKGPISVQDIKNYLDNEIRIKYKLTAIEAIVSYIAQFPYIKYEKSTNTYMCTEKNIKKVWKDLKEIMSYKIQLNEQKIKTQSDEDKIQSDEDETQLDEDETQSDEDEKIRQLKGLGAKPFKIMTTNVIWTIMNKGPMTTRQIRIYLNKQLNSNMTIDATMQFVCRLWGVPGIHREKIEGVYCYSCTEKNIDKIIIAVRQKFRKNFKLDDEVDNDLYLRDNKIRKKEGLGAKPFQTMTKNIIWTIINKSPISTLGIVEYLNDQFKTNKYKLSSVSAILSILCKIPYIKKLKMTKEKYHPTCYYCDEPDVNKVMKDFTKTRDEIQLTEDKIQLTEDKIQLTEDKIQSPKDEIQSPKDEIQLTEDEIQSPKDEIQLTEDEKIRLSKGLGAKPFKTTIENIIWTIIHKGPSISTNDICKYLDEQFNSNISLVKIRSKLSTHISTSQYIHRKRIERAYYYSCDEHDVDKIIKDLRVKLRGFILDEEVDNKTNLLDEEIRQSKGLGAKPFKTLARNVIWTIIYKGPVTSSIISKYLNEQLKTNKYITSSCSSLLTDLSYLPYIEKIKMSDEKLCPWYYCCNEHNIEKIIQDLRIIWNKKRENALLKTKPKEPVKIEVKEEPVKVEESKFIRIEEPKFIQNIRLICEALSTTKVEEPVKIEVKEEPVKVEVKEEPIKVEVKEEPVKENEEISNEEIISSITKIIQKLLQGISLEITLRLK